MKNSADYQAELLAAQQQMKDLLREKMLLDLRIKQTSETINALTYLATAAPPPELAEDDAEAGELFGETGITGAIRLLLHRSHVPLSPVQIKTELQKHGFDFSDYANAMAVIHNTLKRLDKQGELMTVRDASGNVVAYTTRFVGPGSAEKSGMLGDDKLRDTISRVMARKK